MFCPRVTETLAARLSLGSRRMKGSTMSDLFTVAHIAQLHEIQAARLKRGQPGLGSEIEALIARLTSGGVARGAWDIREAQAKRYWDLGVGTALGYPNFAAYLATVPEVPERLEEHGQSFPLLVLVEPRVGLKRLCELANVEFSGGDDTFVAYDERHTEFTKPTWIRIQDGRRNRNRKVSDCRGSFGRRELGLTALQGVCAWCVHGAAELVDLNGPDGHAMDLPGSVHRGSRGDAAYLHVSDGRAKLRWYWGVIAYPKCGSASRRECNKP